MFGMGMGGMGMDMGMDMGMGMGMDMGMDMGMGMGMDMGMGMGMGRNQEIIINNGYGTTIIEERGGMFGPREQIIISNGGYNSNLYGGYGVNNVVVCPPNCQRQCCKPVIVNNPVVYTNRQHHHHKKYQSLQGTKQPSQIVKGTPIVQTVKVNTNPYALHNHNHHHKNEQTPQTVMVISHPMLQLKYGKWEGPREYAINKVKFDRFALNFITKLKCRTNLEPQSNSLENGQIIMKIVIGENQEFYFAAISKTIQDYFYNVILIRMRWNPTQPAQFQGEIQGKIMKKSEFLGNWQLRHVRITKQEGLKSYKNPLQKHTLHIKSVRQLWTRFQIIEGNYLAIKVKHNHKKLEFGIPVNFCGPWVQAFYSLLEVY